MRAILCATLAGLAFAVPAAAEPAKPLFASDTVIRLTIAGPVNELARGGPESSATVAGTLTVAGTPEALPVRLALRGITRRKSEVCQFPPLRVTFVHPPTAGSEFAGQSRLKLVTHCRSADSFQQYVLLEYAAYRLYSRMTAVSFRVRLAQIDYIGDSGRPITSRLGFFIEDTDDVARRNGMREAEGVGTRIAVDRLSPPDAARFGLFEYMIGNLDWAMQAGPPGDNCCHNSRLMGGAGGVSPMLVPVPYDFDFSGLVDAPYAVPPESVRVSNVRQRRYRGFCRHNAEARAAIAQFRAERDSLLGELAAVPGIEPRTLRKASTYLAGFFADIASDSTAEAKLLKTCL